MSCKLDIIKYNSLPVLSYQRRGPLDIPTQSADDDPQRSCHLLQIYYKRRISSSRKASFSCSGCFTSFSLRIVFPSLAFYCPLSHFTFIISSLGLLISSLFHSWSLAVLCFSLSVHCFSLSFPVGENKKKIKTNIKSTKSYVLLFLLA